MKTAILTATLLLAASLAVAPTASADHVDCVSDLETVQMVCAVGDAAVHYAQCYLFTGPAFWLSECV